MSASSSPAAYPADRRVVVESIGSARPALAGVLAHQLGVAPERVANALYRAPAILLDALSAHQAEGLASILQQAGLVVRIEDAAAPRPQAEAVYDIALYIEDIADLPACCERLGGFLGCPPAAALTLLLAPPGVILGNVSLATSDALIRLLDGLAVQVISSLRSQAVYRLLINREPGPMLDRLLQDVKHIALPVSDGQPTLLDQLQAQQLWRRHQAAGGIQLMDCAFLRYDLSLTRVTEASRTDQLPALAGLPAALIDSVVANLPIVVEEGVSHTALPERLQAWQEAAMPVAVSVASLRRCRLLIPGGSQLEPALPLLLQAGLLPPDSGVPTLPWHSPVLQGELLPRWLQAGLEQLQIPVICEELNHEPH